MPTFYNFTENGSIRSFDDVFVPAEFFRDGNLWTWGYNGTAQLGNQSILNSSTPVTTISGGANWKQVSNGAQGNFTTAIKSDGTLWGWGQNNQRQIGANDLGQNISTPVTTFVGGNDWKQVNSGGAHSGAIKTDGTLWMWGTGSSGQMGDGVLSFNAAPAQTIVGGNNWKQVSCGGDHTLAIKTDGTLWVWGSNSFRQLGIFDPVTNKSTPVTTFLGGTNWKQVSGGAYHSAAIKNDGTLWTWGSGSDGQLGNAQITNRSTPVTTFLGGTNWKQVSGGAYHTGAIKTDGTLWMWGDSSFGGIGNGLSVDRSTPVTTFLGGNNWKDLSLGNYSTAAIKTDGTLWTWGLGASGQLGNAKVGSPYTPVTTFLGGTNWKQVSCGAFHMAAVTYIDYPSPT